MTSRTQWQPGAPWPSPRPQTRSEIAAFIWALHDQGLTDHEIDRELECGVIQVRRTLAQPRPRA